MAVAVGSSTSDNGASPLTISHEVVTGSDRILVVSVGTHQGVASGITWDGNAMTQIELGSTAFDEDGSLWAYLNPDVKTADVVVTLSSGSWLGAAATNVTGAKQTLTITSANNVGNSISATVNITPSTDDNVIFAAVGTEATVAANETEIAIEQGQSFENFGAEYFSQGSAALKAMSFSLGGGQRWGIAAMAIEPASAQKIFGDEGMIVGQV